MLFVLLVTQMAVNKKTISSRKNNNNDKKRGDLVQ